MSLLVLLVFSRCVPILAQTCDHKLKTTQQSCTRGKQGLRIVWLMIQLTLSVLLGRQRLVGVSQIKGSQLTLGST